MQLLKLESNVRAYPAPEIAEIAEFRDLIRRDRGSPGDSQGRAKQRAAHELAYIFHANSHESPYYRYEPNLRREKIIGDLFPERDGWDWEVDEIVEAAERKYVELTKTPATLLMDAAMIAVARLTDYFLNISFDPEEGEVGDTAKDVIANLANMPKVISSLRVLREEVEREQGENARLKGGVKTTIFND